jgi:3-dehydroquinate synthase
MQMSTPSFEQDPHIDEVHVDLSERGYRVYLGVNVLAQVSLESHCTGKQVLIVSNTTIAKLYLAHIQRYLPNKIVDVCLLPDGEAHKTLQNAERIFQQLGQMRASGGGVIGDITGFAAALWMRGVPFVQIPTSLLAMVDSSVGGKTAVNLSAGKNLVGAFWQPSAVFADVGMLKTLPKSELAAGFAEVIKYGAIVDADFFAWLETHAVALMQLNLKLVQEAVHKSIQHKSAIVMRDEREQADRMLLNFGHTFGHALETAHDYRGILHGQAVAIGMCCAAQLCANQEPQLMPDLARLENLLRQFELPVNDSIRLRVNDLVALMRLDKKAVSGELRLILWRGIGQAFVSKATDDAIAKAWQGRVDAVVDHLVCESKSY